MHSGGAPLNFDGGDVMFGGDGDDNLIAEGGAVDIFGEGGNDTIIGTSTYGGEPYGDPYFYWDWVSVNYSTSTGDVTANFTDHVIDGLQPGQVADGLGGIDTVSGITVIGDGPGNDAFYFDDSFQMLDGENSYYGANSVFVGLSGGDDLVDFTGMTGMRVVRWASSDGGVTASLVTGTASGSSIGTDRFVNANGLRGTNFDDHLIGDDNDNTFAGGRGHDTIDGGGGAHDEIRFGNSTSGIIVDLSLASNQVISDGLGWTDTLTGIEDVEGGDFDDYIVGDINSNGLHGNFGNDALYGGGGADSLEGGGNADTLSGGADDDIFVMRAIWANGDVITDFEGANTAGGDVLELQDFGPGAKLSNAGGDFWQVDWSDGTDTFQISGVTTLGSDDYLFV